MSNNNFSNILSNIFSSIKKVITPIHKEGYKFIIIFLSISFILSFLSTELSLFGIILSIWCAYFFRDPERFTPNLKNIITSPADGIIANIEENAKIDDIDKIDDINDEILANKKYTKITIFLNIFNVHVNYIPIDGKIINLKYIKGQFLNADLAESSKLNEKQIAILENKTKNKKNYIIFSQIAGFIARRIICDLKEKQQVKIGEKYGIIRFGSRLDIYIDSDIFDIIAKEGQTMIGAETIIAKIKE